MKQWPSRRTELLGTDGGAIYRGTILLADKWHQSHESRSLDSRRYRMLADRRATALAAADDLTVAIDQFGQQFDVLVVDVHRTGTMTIDKNRVFSLRS